MTRAKFLKPCFRPERKRRGLAPWCINVPPYLSDTGRRRQLFYDTREEAEIVCERYRTKKENFGVRLAASLSPKDTAEAAECLERLRPYGVSLLTVVSDYIEARRRREASVSFLELANRYIDSRPDRHPDHLSGLRNSRDRFPDLHTKMVSEIDHHELESLLTPVKPGGRNLLMRHFRAFFNFGIRKGWMTENPIKRLEFARRPKKEVETIPLEQVRAMLEHAAAEDLPLLPYLVFGFYAGIRPEDELAGLEWRDFDWSDGTLTVRPEITKTARRRHVKLEENALEWLRFYRDRGGKLRAKIVSYSEKQLRPRRLENRKAAGVTHWPNSGMRHTYCSNHLNAFEDLNRLMLMTGHSHPQTFWDHYYKAVRKEEAVRYWQIRPPAQAENVVAFQARP